MGNSKEDLISRFLEIVEDENPFPAREFLRAAEWNLDEALQQFFYARDGADTSDEDEFSGDALLSAFAPVKLTFRGTYEMARRAAELEKKWLLVNLQSPEESSSFTLNTDTWRNKKVIDAVRGNFIFWQGDCSTEEGSRVANHLALESLPATVVVEPFTGLKPLTLAGMVQPEDLLNMLGIYRILSPTDHSNV